MLIRIQCSQANIPLHRLSGCADKLSLNLSQGALLCLHHCEPYKHHGHCIDDLHTHKFVMPWVPLIADLPMLSRGICTCAAR